MAAFSRRKTLPPLAQLLVTAGRPWTQGRQTMDEQRVIVQMLSQQYGIPLRERTKKR